MVTGVQCGKEGGGTALQSVTIQLKLRRPERNFAGSVKLRWGASPLTAVVTMVTTSWSLFR